ncbi:MAG: TetR/AcrR family transcriptional regulator, partial [Actinomycetes bacterium]
IYTHFGGMDELRREIRREGFRRLAEQLDAAERTDDPLADLAALGWAYYVSATASPNLYRAMFLEGPVDDQDLDTGLETFERLVAGVQRCIDAGRFADADATDLATQLWALEHGVVSLQLAHLLAPEQAVASLRSIGVNLLRAYRADRDAGAAEGDSEGDRGADPGA